MTIARLYLAPVYSGLTPLMPSQQSSFSGIRTALTCHDAMALIEAALLGPSKTPQPWTHAYSEPERLTPWKRTRRPFASRRRLPTT